MLRNLYQATQQDSFVSTNYLKGVRCSPQLFSGPGTDLHPLLSLPQTQATPAVSTAQLVQALALRPGRSELPQVRRSSSGASRTRVQRRLSRRQRRRL